MNNLKILLLDILPIYPIIQHHFIASIHYFTTTPPPSSNNVDPPKHVYRLTRIVLLLQAGFSKFQDFLQ